MHRSELVGVLGLLGLSALLVSGGVQLPPSAVLLLSSPISKIVLVLLVIGIFCKSPVVGIAATVAVAVLLFSRNVRLVSSEGSFLTNWMNSFFGAGAAPAAALEAADPIPDAYPTDHSRPDGPAETRSYAFLPSEDMGSDAFVRSGPQMDEKLAVLR
jgi:hypothetical protein